MGHLKALIGLLIGWGFDLLGWRGETKKIWDRILLSLIPGVHDRVEVAAVVAEAMAVVVVVVVASRSTLLVQTARPGGVCLVSQKL